MKTIKGFLLFIKEMYHYEGNKMFFPAFCVLGFIVCIVAVISMTIHTSCAKLCDYEYSLNGETKTIKGASCSYRGPYRNQILIKKNGNTVLECAHCSIIKTRIYDRT